jgi:serine/threonine protein kinase
MFAQMCEAVAACHYQHVFHRDIKPENFIVTDGWTTLPNGRQERKVIVKLTDFGLSTTDVASSDMDCGSAPYMSYGTICTPVVMSHAHDSLQNAEIILLLLIALVLPMSGPSALC